MSDAKAAGKSRANTNDDASKVKLLISCIKNNTNGTINWQAVAEDCDITGNDGEPSKGAANKRFTRILKSHGIDPSTVAKAAAGGSSNRQHAAETSSSRGKRKDASALNAKTNCEDEVNGAPNKKRKAGTVKDEKNGSGDENGESPSNRETVSTNEEVSEDESDFI